MRKNNVLLDDEPAPAITPDTLSKVKKEDMKQAVVERFSGEKPSKRTPTKIRRRSPYWVPVDEGC